MYRNKWLIVCFITALTAVSLLFPTQAYYLNTAKPISKGSNGVSCVYLLTFKHESLISFLKTAESRKGLYLMELPFMERNADVIKVMVEQNHAIGLITESTMEEFNLNVFNEEIAQFKKLTNSDPLWATAANGEFSEELLQASHTASINMLAANTYFDSSLVVNTLPNGSFIFINADQDFDFLAKKHIELVHSAQVRSIEENLFNLKTKEQSLP